MRDSKSPFISQNHLIVIYATKLSPPIPPKSAIIQNSKDGLEIIGVLHESTAEIGAVASYRDKHKIDFCLTRDNGQFHNYFSLGVSPTFAIIDREGIIRGMTNGFDIIQPEKSEKQLRKFIETCLSADEGRNRCDNHAKPVSEPEKDD